MGGFLPLKTLEQFDQFASSGFGGVATRDNCLLAVAKTDAVTVLRVTPELRVLGTVCSYAVDRPAGVAFTDATLLIADFENARLLEIDMDGNLLRCVVMMERPKRVLYQNRKLYVGSTYTVRSYQYDSGDAEFSFSPPYPPMLNPAGMSIANNEHLFVADCYRHRILQFNVHSGAYISVVATVRLPRGILCVTPFIIVRGPRYTVQILSDLVLHSNSSVVSSTFAPIGTETVLFKNEVTGRVQLLQTEWAGSNRRRWIRVCLCA